MRKNSPGLNGAALIGAGLGFVLALRPGDAWSHVKWFAQYDIARAPVGLMGLLNPTFIELLVLMLLLLWSLCSFERTFVGAAMLGSIDQVFVHMRGKIDVLIRAGTAAFFVAIWAHGGIILTPELTTTVIATEWLQAAIAAGMLFVPTLPLSALGMVVLFVQGIWNYGLFHMMDYPIFLGVAGYFTITGMGRASVMGVRAFDVMRVGAAVTLLWASVEKWAFPNWSYPVLEAHSALTLGLDPRFYMIAAGMVEFGLAFALLWTPLVRRMAAVVLLAMFVSAVVEFGKLDAIGHLVIIVVLLAIAADVGTAPDRRPAMAPVWLSVALAATILLYYGGHALMFGTSPV